MTTANGNLEFGRNGAAEHRRMSPKHGALHSSASCTLLECHLSAGHPVGAAEQDRSPSCSVARSESRTLQIGYAANGPRTVGTSLGRVPCTANQEPFERS